jgi:hypothetical protein
MSPIAIYCATVDGMAECYALNISIHEIALPYNGRATDQMQNIGTSDAGWTLIARTTLADVWLQVG